MRLMGLDMGTSGCKAVVFDEKFNIVCDAYREYALSFPGEGLLELDPELVWSRMSEVIVEANGKTDETVSALAISAIGDVILPLYKDGTPVRDSIIDFDPRGTEQIKKCIADFGEKRFFEITGMPPLFIGSLAKIHWLKENEPDTYAATARWSTYEDYIVQKLGLQPAVSWSEAARTMLLDIRSKQWSKEILEQAQIKESMLPKTVPSGEKLGTVERNISKALGFTAPPVVVSGGHDMVCAAIGAGLDERRQSTAVNIAGTIEGIVAAMGEANTDKIMLENSFPCYPGFDGYVTFSVNLTAGCVFRWYRDVIAKDVYQACMQNGTDAFTRMLEDLDVEKPGAMQFVPHFSGSGNPYFDPDGKGVIYGLTLDSSRADIVQALIEGLCYEVRQHLEAFAQAGVRIDTLRAVGGGAQDVRQIQMKASITGMKVLKGSVSESSALGAAALAGYGMGIISHPSEAFRAVKAKESCFEPDMAAHKRFESTYRKYVDLSRTVNRFEQRTNT